MVEHDEDTMKRADRIVDMGPGAGVHGGRVMAQGTFEELAEMPDSVTGWPCTTSRTIRTAASAAGYLPARMKPRGSGWRAAACIT